MTLEISTDDDEVGYLSLKNHPGRGIHDVVEKQIRLSDLLKYSGPDIYLDLDVNGRVIGLEMLG